MGIVAHDPADLDLDSKGIEVAGHVRGAAQGKVLIDHLHHRNRRLRRNPLHLPPDVLVDDEISENDDPDSIEPVKNDPQIFHRIPSRDETLTPSDGFVDTKSQNRTGPTPFSTR